MAKLVTKRDPSSWLTQGRTAIVMKYSHRGSTSSNYQPITCLSATGKLLFGILVDEIKVYIGGYTDLAQRDIDSGSRGLKHRLLIDQSVAKNT